MNRSRPHIWALLAALGLWHSPAVQCQSPATTRLRVVYVRKQVEAGELFGARSIVLLTNAQGQPELGALVKVTVDTGGGYFNNMDTATTNGDGIASFSESLVLFRSPGAARLVFQAGAASDSASIQVSRGPTTKIIVTRQPSSQIVSDSVLKVQPIVRAVDNAGNVLDGVEIAADICYGRKLDSITCARRSLSGEALQGNTIAKTDATGDAHFNDLVIQGPEGYYRLLFQVLGPPNRQGITALDTSSVMLYDADRVFDRSYVVISAIKSIAGRIPSDEFFDVRFRYRYARSVFALANIDVALSGRGSDTVRSNQQALTEAAASLNWTPLKATRSTPITNERERSLFVGMEVRVFNTLPYWGWQVGSVEHAGSPFNGSSATIGLLHRMTDTLRVVQGDTLVSQPWSLFADFFLTSTSIPFFKALNLRGGLLLPLRGGKPLDSRIVVAVPVGTINLF